ncbi:oligosaccharide flippase family protein, partial [Holdemanella porci]
ILIFSFAFSLIGGSFLGNMVLLPSGNEKIYMNICCITAVFNVGLNYLLIPKGGACAAAFTTAFSSLLIMILLLIKKDKNIRLDYLKQAMLSPCIGAIAICVFCRLTKTFVSGVFLKTGVCVVGSIIIYGILMIVLKNELCLQTLDTFKARVKK